EKSPPPATDVAHRADPRAHVAVAISLVAGSVLADQPETRQHLAPGGQHPGGVVVDAIVQRSGLVLDVKADDAFGRGVSHGTKPIIEAQAESSSAGSSVPRDPAGP